MDVMDGGGGVELMRARCFDLAAAAFSSNQLSLERYESLAGEIASANDLPALKAIERALPDSPRTAPVQSQLVTANMSKVAKLGRWIESPRVVLRGNMAKIILDFTAYEAERNLRVELELDCKASNVRIIVPTTVDVVERLSSNSMSVFKSKRLRTMTNNAIVISGNLSMSNVKIKRRKARLPRY